ncbi:hypothetical protein BLNAU_10340 [Blattamonas nauphoetae]|uniref:Uncharacterized protein n=1 Tax=Blattamonas nauphoetae TaxID=2049346 RepID=A0ABQ9XT73_9EUKA|nr:hypothetical protein BLNAU_10340 [Blattamonas nauphoetae]
MHRLGAGNSRVEGWRIDKKKFEEIYAKITQDRKQTVTSGMNWPILNKNAVFGKQYRKEGKKIARKAPKPKASKVQ